MMRDDLRMWDPEIIVIVIDGQRANAIEGFYNIFDLKIGADDMLKSWRIWMNWCRELPPPRHKSFPALRLPRQAASRLWRPARRECGHVVGHSPRVRSRHK